MTAALRVFSVLLMLGLMLPVCIKAFGTSTVASVVSETSSGDGSDLPGNLPCVSCCGGWIALLPSFVLPEPKRNDLAVLTKPETRPAAQVQAVIAAHDPPPEWRLLLALPHSYALMHARTDRLLL